MDSPEPEDLGADPSHDKLMQHLQEQLQKHKKSAEEQYNDEVMTRNVMLRAVNTPEALLNIYTTYSKNPELRPGMLVTWKPGLCNRSILGPFVVIEIVPRDQCVRCTPDTMEDANTASPLFHEPLDVRIAFLAPEGRDRTLMYWLDSHRLQEHVEAPVTEAKK